MTYAGFLAAFLLPPIALLAVRTLIARSLPRRGLLSIAILALIALLYTTPWDNFLIANHIWWYEPTRVIGLALGWVPVEEYLFFILQPIATGLWTIAVLARSPLASINATTHRGPRLRSAGLLALAWGAALLALVVEAQSWRYLALILIWALPPLSLQVLYGADQLWIHRRIALLAVLPPTLYLAAADALAIGQGIWTINPTYSLGLNFSGILPIEEFLFFLLTNCLIAFALILIASRWPFAATTSRRMAS